MHALNSEAENVVHCRVGGRRAEAYHLLTQAGFQKIKHLKGRSLAWAAEVDQTLPTD